MPKVKKYEFSGIDGKSWVQFAETEDKQFIQISVREVDIKGQTMITGICLVDKDTWNDIFSVRYDLRVDETPPLIIPSEELLA